MNKYILKNGAKIIYEHRTGNLTSFCIGFEAGALMEEGYELGTAHAVEHMLFKGTKKRKEYEINKQCDELFGFNNAMTNYPYCIYYGTTLSEDFYNGFELYSDIILNPSFPKEGFKEEIDIICEELKEWQDDITQYCEDMLLYNSFNNRRIKNLIIGTEESIRAITLNDIKKFYNEFYAPENCVISVVTSLPFDELLRIIEALFGSWNNSYKSKELLLNENNNPGTFTHVRQGLNGSKIQFIYPIHELNSRELKILNIFNTSFGNGTSSLLYDQVRTKNGLVYDIGSTIKEEKGIKLFSIFLGTSVENIEIALSLIENIIEKVKVNKEYFNLERINRNLKILKIKKELKAERSIELCKNLATAEIMFNSSDSFYNEFDDLNEITEQEMLLVINKVLSKPSIQIIKP